METSDTRFKGFPNADNVRLSETIIVADADYLDDVAFRFTVQGERILGRRVPKADLSQWAVDAALDGGLRADGKSHTTQVLLVHEKASSQLRNFSPSVYSTELNAQAFTDPHLGEFLVNDVAVGDMVGKDDYILDVVRLVLGHSEVRRLIIIPNAEVGTLYAELQSALHGAATDQRITIFTMSAMPGGSFCQEQLAYSVMDALGISAEELEHHMG